MKLFKILAILYFCIFFAGCDVRGRSYFACREGLNRFKNVEEKYFSCNEKFIPYANSSQTLYMYDIKNPNLAITYGWDNCGGYEPCVSTLIDAVPEKYKEASKSISSARLAQMRAELISLNSKAWQEYRNEVMAKKQKSEQELERLKNL
ncbi:hypothetical protein [Campylobacter sp. JMF_03 NE3]|uniref:hypothetical protein n=1 Tax=Campylobacter sp. JMF_03 NE3 TaxID=2983831 RepID=UPI0022E9D6D1|nr:hypothetical protein [Campylobacter sp. JMF_03 NE3]MDA3053558.1 hypothetical protein [Campylobacter sp. JMF_03 NE3]